MRAAAASNSPSSRRGGANAKQRSTWSRYGSGSPGEARRLGLERDELGVEPVAPVRLGDLVGEPGAQGHRVVAQAGRRAELLHVDLGLEVGRAEVAVDEARDVLVEPERRGGGSRGRSGRASGRSGSRPWPGSSLHPIRSRGALGASWSWCASAARRASARRSARPGSIGRPARSGARSTTARRPPHDPGRTRPRRARGRRSRRRTASPGARPHRGSSAARRSSARRPRGRRRPPRRRSSGGRGRCPSACRPSARRGGSGPCSPRPWRAGRPSAGATSGATAATARACSRVALVDQLARRRR